MTDPRKTRAAGSEPPPREELLAHLEERGKELRCLYEVVRFAIERQEAPLAEVLRGLAGLVARAFQHADVAVCRIALDHEVHRTGGFDDAVARQAAPITVAGRHRGWIEVAYVAERPPADEGPFLAEERDLLDAVALEVAGIVERRESRRERVRLEEQLRHADRLATIGQLAAGVAHELNDPLGTILGFAQLLEKDEGLGDEARGDVAQIVRASLHARNIVSKLRLFARQTPSERAAVDLNQVVREGLYITETQCAKLGVELVRDLDDLPAIEADAGQLHQVLTNLTVNAMQAMPSGGRMTVRTRAREREVALVVEDTGGGISPEVRARLFEPFFTTKPAEQGTGLGLAVVHGIVESHGGLVEVASEPGRGARFEVRLPRDARAPLAEAPASDPAPPAGHPRSPR